MGCIETSPLLKDKRVSVSDWACPIYRVCLSADEVVPLRPGPQRVKSVILANSSAWPQGVIGTRSVHWHDVVQFSRASCAICLRLHSVSALFRVL